jgi:hypothetical protein
MQGGSGRVGWVIRRIALVAPLVASQSGCSSGVRSQSSCDGFVSVRTEARIPIPRDTGGPDAGDAGISDGWDGGGGCETFCAEFGAQLGLGAYSACSFDQSADGGRVVVCSYNTMCTGRYPEGFCPPEPSRRAPLLGRYFASMAAGEAASVVAFERMAQEIAEHGLPARLARRARRAAAEEARHYRTTAALARRFGARAVRGDVAKPGSRSLFEMALENAREGVVRETVGAVVGHFQSLHAEDDQIRRAMKRIAVEETSHAVLSWELDASARSRLTVRERRELDRAVRTALDEMERAASDPVCSDLVRFAGLPAASVGRELVAAARRALFDGRQSGAVDA